MPAFAAFTRWVTDTDCRLDLRCLTEIDDMANRGTDTMGLQDIFSWLGDGLSFKIHNRQKFIDVIMPLYFPRIKHASFSRQLSKLGW